MTRTKKAWESSLEGICSQMSLLCNHFMEDLWDKEVINKWITLFLSWLWKFMTEFIEEVQKRKLLYKSDTIQNNGSHLEQLATPRYLPSL